MLLIASHALMAQDSDTPLVPMTSVKVSTQPLDAVAFSPDNTMLAVGGRDNLIHLLDVETGETIRVLRGHEDWITSVAFHPSGTLLASGSRDGTVRLWNSGDGTIQETLRHHDDSVSAVTFMAEGKVIASASRDGSLWLGVVETGETVVELENFGGSVWDIAASPDGTTLATASEDGTIWLWGLLDWETETWIAALRGHEGPVVSVVFSPDGTSLLSSGLDGTIRQWALRDVRSIDSPQSLVFRGHLAPALGVGFTTEGRAALSASLDGTVRIWNSAEATSTDDDLATLSINNVPLTHLAANHDGTLAASVNTEGFLTLWDVSEDRIQALIEVNTPSTVTARPLPTQVVAAPSPRAPRVVLPTPAPLPTGNGPSLFIPSVNIRSPIKTFPLNGESWDIDLWEPLVGHLQGTAWLNMTGNIVLGGHSELPDRKPGIFAGLYNVGPGDEVFLREGEVDRRYLVVEVRVVKREDLSVVYPTNHNRLTLIASHIPSYVPGTDLYTERLIVIAHMIE